MDESGKATIEGESGMKDLRFEALLAAARPEKTRANVDFTEKVMTSIRSSEILSSQIRKKSVNKKETLFMKLRHLPKFAIVAIAIGALLVVSGTAFAAYQLLWPKPQVHVSAPTTSVSGRQEVAISFASCGASDLASHYELKSNATITIDEVPNVVKAHCELDAISTWAAATFPHDKPFAPFRTEKEYDSVMLDTAMATHIKSSDGTSITFMGLTKYNQTDATFATSAKTKYIANGTYVSAKDITSNDPVVYITSEVNHFTQSDDCTPQHCSTSGKPVSNDLLAVVKLSQPFQFYDQFAWQSLTERTTCEGNPNDTCLSGFSGAIDLYENNIVPEIGKTQMKEIQGVVTELNGNTTVIRSSSGTLFTIVNATDIVSAYNTQKAAQYYNNLTVKVGSSLRVSYIEEPTLHTRTLASAMLMGVQLQTEQVGKSDLPSAY
jgi:hypothetical protein